MVWQGTLGWLVLSLPLLAMLAAPAVEAPESCPDSTTRLGPVDAPTQVDAYLDPTTRNALTTFLQLRRWVTERPGDVTVALHLVYLGVKLDPRADRVRVWMASMAARGRLTSVIRAARRDGVDRLYVRLSTAEGRAGLAEELGIDPAEHEQAAAQSCHARGMNRARAEVSARMRARGTGVFRLPVFVIGDLAFEDSGLLDRLRPATGRLRSSARARSVRPSAPLPEPRAASARLRRPKVRGATLGGRGLPHRFVLMARDEDDPTLFSLLPPLLEYRARHPGELSITIVARGLSVEHGLRKRLCAAERKGLVPAYLRLLARDPASRNADPATTDLLESLDDRTGSTNPAPGPSKDPAAAPCDSEPDEAEEDLPDGGWLDGIPATRSELDNLEGMLRLLEATGRPLSPLIAPPIDDPL